MVDLWIGDRQDGGVTNHQVVAGLMLSLGEHLTCRSSHGGVAKIIASEGSGIASLLMVGLAPGDAACVCS